MGKLINFLYLFLRDRFYWVERLERRFLKGFEFRALLKILMISIYFLGFQLTGIANFEYTNYS